MTKKLLNLSLMPRHLRFALIAILLVLPAFILTVSISYHIEAVEVFVKSFLTSDGAQPNLFGKMFMAGVLASMPVTLLVSLWPMFEKGPGGKRRFFAVNAVVAALILLLMYPTFGGLIKDFWNCDVLKIPNCD
jgi:hypothetical protein